MLCELETDKVSVEVPSPVAGVLAEIVAPEGATVDAKARLAVVTEGAAGVALKAGAPKAAAEAAVGIARRGSGTAEAARRRGRALGQEAHGRGGASTADQVIGTGRDGRIMKEDVANAAAARRPPPVVPPRPSPPIPRAPGPAEDAAREERVKMTRLRQTIARRLKEAQNTAAMLTTYNEVDMTGRWSCATPTRTSSRRSTGSSSASCPSSPRPAATR